MRPSPFHPLCCSVDPPLPLTPARSPLPHAQAPLLVTCLFLMLLWLLLPLLFSGGAAASGSLCSGRCSAFGKVSGAAHKSGGKARDALVVMLHRFLRRQNGICNHARNYLRWIVRHDCPPDRVGRWQHLLADANRCHKLVAVLVLHYPRGIDVMVGDVPAPANDAHAEAEAVGLLRQLWKAFPRTYAGALTQAEGGKRGVCFIYFFPALEFRTPGPCVRLVGRCVGVRVPQSIWMIKLGTAATPRARPSWLPWESPVARSGTSRRLICHGADFFLTSVSLRCWSSVCFHHTVPGDASLWSRCRRESCARGLLCGAEGMSGP